MAQQRYDQNFSYAEDLTVRETFVDGIESIAADGSTARILFSISRMSQPTGQEGPSGQKLPAARLVMPLAALVKLHGDIGQILSGLEQQGTITRNPMGESEAGKGTGG